jgi:hypothetical protein
MRLIWLIDWCLTSPLTVFQIYRGVFETQKKGNASSRVWKIESRSRQTKNYKIVIYCISSKHSSLMSKSKDWLSRNQNNVFECSNKSTSELLFQWVSTVKIQLSVQSEHHHHLAMIYLRNCSFGNNYSLTFPVKHGQTSIILLNRNDSFSSLRFFVTILSITSLYDILWIHVCIIFI